MSLPRNVNETIKQQYLTPFFNSINTAKLNTAEALRSAVYILHRYGPSILTKDALTQILKSDKTLKKNPLLTTTSCHESFLNLAKLYFDPSEQQKIIPEDKEETERLKKAFGGDNMIPMGAEILANMPAVDMQTRIRDMLYDEINPVSCLSIDSIKSLLPENNKNANIVYALSNPIDIKVKKFHLFPISRENIPNGEILASIKDSYDVTLFPTLYQASEWACYESIESNKKTLHPVWAVVFNGDIEKECRGTTQFNIMNRPSLFCRGAGVLKAEVIPLRGVMLQVQQGFANSKIMCVADMPYQELEQKKAVEMKK